MVFKHVSRLVCLTLSFQMIAVPYAANAGEPTDAELMLAKHEEAKALIEKATQGLNLKDENQKDVTAHTIITNGLDHFYLKNTGFDLETRYRLSEKGIH